jgi:hypothetical protein
LTSLQTRRSWQKRRNIHNNEGSGCKIDSTYVRSFYLSCG